MRAFLKTALPVLGLMALAIIVGLTIEWFRRRNLKAWVREVGGTFEPGGIWEGVTVPEAEPFDRAFGSERPTYHEVTRVARPEAAYVVAQYYRSYLDTRNDRKSVSCVVVFVVREAADLPEVAVYRASGAEGLRKLVGLPERRALAVAGATPEFASQFKVTALSGAAESPPDPSPESLDRLLPRAVQEELLRHEGLIAGLQVRGGVVRVQAVGQATGYPHREVFEVAQRMAAAWAGTSR